MGSEEARDPLQGVDWKAVGNDMQKNPGDKPGMKKRLPKKIRQIPECYFLPRRSRLYNFTFVSACIAGGIGAGMLVEMWINKKVRGTPFGYHVWFLSLCYNTVCCFLCLYEQSLIWLRWLQIMHSY